MIPNPVIFTPVLAASLLFFIWSCYRRFSLVKLGRGEDRFNELGTRFINMLLFAFGQKRVVSRPFGINHFVIFWSFMVLVAANTEFLVRGILPSFSLSLLPASIHHLMVLAFDFVSALAVISVCIAAVRRIVNPPYEGACSVDAFVILTMIAALMLAFFGLHGAEIAMGNEEAGAWMPVSSYAATLLSASLEPETLSSVASWCWWIHAVVLLGFLNYLPYSKHMHILTAIPSCFFRNLETSNTLPREEFAGGNSFGVGRIDQFTWKDLFDSFSCTECGRCQQACPAAFTGKALNPREVIHTIKENLLNNGPLLERTGEAVVPLIGNGKESIGEDAIWSCTTCGACMAACPVFIEQMPKLVKMRRNLVEMDARFPDELLNLFENMEQRSNPWGIAPAERIKWCSQIDVQLFEAKKTEYLFYIGCAGSFDSRSKQVTVAMARILDAAGVSWGILGKEEKCCGDSLRRLGNEYVFDKMARDNVAMFREKGVTKVITQCPHCFTTLKNDYRQYGLELDVIPHAELIDRLMADGRLKLTRQVKELGNIVFHDSCYLGRHNGVYAAPRSVIAGVTGTVPREMERNLENSFCCGAGGGRMWMEEHQGQRINLTRVTEALEKNPDTICVTCPYCMTMFEDGLKDCHAGQTRVRDIAEVVAEGMRSVK